MKLVDTIELLTEILVGKKEETRSQKKTRTTNVKTKRKKDLNKTKRSSLQLLCGQVEQNKLIGMAELSIISPVLVVVTGGYLSIFPKIAGNNIDKMSLCDLVCWSFVLVMVGLKYWGTGYEFSLLLFSVNWFWFTVIVYVVIEIPFFIWYCKKHDVSLEMTE